MANNSSMTQAELRAVLLDGVRDGMIVAEWNQKKKVIIYKHVEHTDDGARKLSPQEIVALWDAGYE
jgi:hypothetical protein